MDESNLTMILDQVQHVETLFLNGNFFYFNLDNFVNLKELLLQGTVEENFNFELFKNLCNQLEDLKICLPNIDNKTFFKLLDHRFSYLLRLKFRQQIKTIDKNFIDRFPMLKELKMSECDIEKIENDALSNLKQLEYIDLSRNSLESFEKNFFLSLKNLDTVDLQFNKLKNFDPEFAGLRNWLNYNHIWYIC